MGTCGIAIGASGLLALQDLRGSEDRHGRRLEVSVVGLADELAGAASVVMGRAARARRWCCFEAFPGARGRLSRRSHPSCRRGPFPMTPGKVLATGGVQGAKLGLGLLATAFRQALTFVVNTGDDFGPELPISPDLDTLPLYPGRGSECRAGLGPGRRKLEHPETLRAPWGYRPVPAG